MPAHFRLRPWHIGVALAAASCNIVMRAPAQYFGRQHDDVLYVIAAQALSDGSYRLFTTPGYPPLTFVMPGFPMLLNPVVWTAGDRPGAYQAFCALILAACPWAVMAWLKRRMGEAAALLSALIFATSPFVLSQTGSVMPEGAYTFLFCLLMIALIDRDGVLEGWRGRLLLAITQIRPAGLSILPAALARPLKERRYGEVFSVLLWPAVGIAAWLIWCRYRSGSAHEIFEWAVTYQGRGFGQPLWLILDNAAFYIGSLGSCFLPLSWGAGPAAWLTGASLLAIALAGLARGFLRDTTSPEAWALSVAGLMHLLWGWRYERYLIALVPLLLWALAEAVGRRQRLVLGSLLLLQILFHGGDFLRPTSWSRPELKDAYAWIQAHTQPSDVLASLLYARDGFYARRPSLPMPSAPDSERLAERLKRRSASYVLWQDRLDLGLSGPGPALEAVVARAGRQLEDPRLFDLMFQEQAGHARIYRVR